MQIIKEAALRLWRKRGRSLMTMGGIVIGVALVSLVTVIGSAGRMAVNTELENMGFGGLSITANGQAVLDEQALAALRQMQQVETAVPLMLDTTSSVATDGQEVPLMLCGIDSGEVQAIGLIRRFGRMLHREDVIKASSVCVVDTAVAMTLFGEEQILGRTVMLTVGGVEQGFHVVGVTQAGSSLLQNVTQMIPGMVYIPYTTMQQLTGRTAFDQLAVRLQDEATGTAAVKRELKKLGGDFRTDDLSAQKDRMGAVMDVVVWILTAIGAVSLLVAGLSIMTIMMVSVGERTREIGIKKALGATDGRILREFLCEALLLSLGGGVVGVLLGGGVGSLGLTLVGMTGIGWRPILWLIGFSVIVGMLFGAAPAWKAARLDPVEALRYE